MMCTRCEHRAQFLDALNEDYQPRPRHECGDITSSKIACYMYRPCKPVIMTQLNKDDPRPQHGGYFGCRMRGVKLADLRTKAVYLGAGESVLLYDI